MDFVRLVNNVKRFFQDEEYICNENAPELTKEQYTALNVGAVMGGLKQVFLVKLMTISKTAKSIKIC